MTDNQETLCSQGEIPGNSKLPLSNLPWSNAHAHGHSVAVTTKKII